MPELRTIDSQDCWVLESNCVQAAVTKLGGMLGPVSFELDQGKTVQPYWISPWQGEQGAPTEGLLSPMRGDFFCLPFGIHNEYKHHTFPVHGYTAAEPWERISRESLSPKAHELQLQIKVPGMSRGHLATVTKRIILRDNETVIYSQHEIVGWNGPATIGHHATLNPGEKPDSMLLSTAPFAFGVTQSNPPMYNRSGEYSALAPDALFDSLHEVPSIWNAPSKVDCSSFPTRKGYCDILTLFARHREPGTTMTPHWTAAVFPDQGFLWFALKNPRILPATVIWSENRGRHSHPWNGRTVCVGLEDVCGYGASGLSGSVGDNLARRKGIATSLNLNGDTPFIVNYIQGILAIPPGFDRVSEVAFSPNGAEFRSESGKTAASSFNVNFVMES